MTKRKRSRWGVRPGDDRPSEDIMRDLRKKIQEITELNKKNKKKNNPAHIQGLRKNFFRILVF